MTKSKFVLIRIALLLASATAPIATADVAFARGGGGGGGHQGMSHQMSEPQGNRQSHMASAGMPMRSVMSKPSVHKEKGGKTAQNKHSRCGKLILPTAGCARPARDPVGNTRPSLPTEAKQPSGTSRQPVMESAKKPGSQSATQPGSQSATQAGTGRQPVLEYVKKPGDQSATQPGSQSAAAAQPAGAAAPSAAAPTKVSVTNGVSSSTIDPGKGLTVSSTGNGTISVSNGTNTVALVGGSVTLHGAPTVTAGTGVQVVHLSNGDYSVAASLAAPAKPAGNANVPPGVTLGDDLKFVGGHLAATPVAVAGAAAGVFETPFAAAYGLADKHPVRDTKQFISDYTQALRSVTHWVANLF